MSDTSTFNLTDAFNRLQQIVSEFESGKVDLESGIPKFKEGLELARKLKERLEKIENEIVEIKTQFKDLDQSSDKQLDLS